MKYHLLLTGLFVSLFFLQAQNTNKIAETIQNEEPDYDTLDSIAKMMNYKEGDNVKVFTRFAINEQGELVNIKVRGPHEYFEKEAIKILKQVPKLDPAMKDGKPHRTEFSLPINFRIETKAERKRRLKKEKRNMKVQ